MSLTSDHRTSAAAGRIMNSVVLAD